MNQSPEQPLIALIETWRMRSRNARRALNAGLLSSWGTTDEVFTLCADELSALLVERQTPPDQEQETHSEGREQFLFWQGPILRKHGLKVSEAPASPVLPQQPESCQHEHWDRGPLGVTRCTDCGIAYGQQKVEEVPRVDEHTVIPPERATASADRWFVERLNGDGTIRVWGWMAKADADQLVAGDSMFRMWEHPDDVRARIESAPADLPTVSSGPVYERIDDASPTLERAANESVAEALGAEEIPTVSSGRHSPLPWKTCHDKGVAADGVSYADDAAGVEAAFLGGANGDEKRLADAALIVAAVNERADYLEAKGYLTRLFQHLAPQCEPQSRLAGLATQIDNYIAGLKASGSSKADDAVVAVDRVTSERPRASTEALAVPVVPPDQGWQGLRLALEESLKLQSHYAVLLNQYDGGERNTFSSADIWMARLRTIGLMPLPPTRGDA